MIYHNNILAISRQELAQFFPERTITSWRLEIVKQGKGADNYTLYNFNSLPPRKQEIVKNALEMPPEQVAAGNSFKDKVIYDLDAINFFNRHKLASGKNLPDEVKQVYANNAAVLNTMKRILTDAIEMRIKTQDKKPKKVFEYFAKTITPLKKELNHTLPEAARPLQRVFEYYTGKKQKKNGTTGYMSLISDMYCNDFSRKVDEETDLNVLLKLIAHPNHFDNVWIAEKYNSEWAMPNSRKTIEAATVLLYRKKYDIEISGLLEGYKKAYGKAVPIIRREAPSAPLLFVGSDDCHIDWYFRLKGIKDVENDNFFRPKMIMVMDAHCRYILGWACGMTVTTELVKMAYLNALHHIKELTGNFYSFHQIQYDRFGLKKLSDIYAAVAEHDFEKNAKGKSHPRKRVIESFFSKELHKILKQNPHGYSGHNWDAKSKINSEHLQADMKNYPVFSDLPLYMRWLVNEMRQSKMSGCSETKQAMWLKSWAAMDLDKRKPLDDVARFKAFGILHKDLKSGKPETYTLKNDVFSPKLLGVKREYLFIDEEEYIANYGVKFNIMYDPYDLSTVMAINEDGTRSMLLAETKRTPMAVADYTEGSRELLNFRLTQNKKIVKYLKESTQRIIDAPLDTDGMLKMNMQKGLQQAAAEMLQLTGGDNKRIDMLNGLADEDDSTEVEPVYNGNDADYGYEDF